jgi:hypothetical protein
LPESNAAIVLGQLLVAEQAESKLHRRYRRAASAASLSTAAIRWRELIYDVYCSVQAVVFWLWNADS